MICISQRRQLPEGRSGHSLSVIDSKLILFGGRGSSDQLLGHLMHIFDPKAGTWTKLESDLQPRCHHSALVAKAQNTTGCPNEAGDDRTFPENQRVEDSTTHRLFIFGGSGGTNVEDIWNKFYGNLSVQSLSNGRVVDCPTWHRNGEEPTPRSDTSLCALPERGSLIMFGGWSNEWHEDVFALEF